MAEPSPKEVLALMRGLLRQTRLMKDYNFRSYAKRRTILGFRENKELPSDAALKEYQDGRKQLASLQRQTILSQLYPAKMRSVMEIPKSSVAELAKTVAA